MAKVNTKSINLLLHKDSLNSQLSLGKYAKADAIRYLSEQGIEFEKKVSYSSKQTDRPEFWINPPTEVLTFDWNIIFNNTNTQELLVLRIPANTLHTKEHSGSGLYVRADNSNLIDLNINVFTLKDRRTGIDFAHFVTNRVKYGSIN